MKLYLKPDLVQIFPLQHEPQITGTNQNHNSCRNMTSFCSAILLLEYVKIGNSGCIKNGFLRPAILLLECVKLAILGAIVFWVLFVLDSPCRAFVC
jgi:hypothetical protein